MRSLVGVEVDVTWGRLYTTASGVLVELRGPVVGGKAACYRYLTGGYHGMLWLKRLRRSRRRPGGTRCST